MSITVNVICYKSKVLKNNENPLMVRLCKNRKTKYIGLGISVNPNLWDFEKNKPKRNCPNKEQIEQIILQKTKAYSEQIMEFKRLDRDFTLTTLIEKVNNPVKVKTVNELFLEQIQKFYNEKRINYSLSHKQLHNSLLQFNKHLDIYFSDIDVIWLKKYESFLRQQQLSENTIGIRFRTFRAVYNTAIEKKIVKQEYYPFDLFKVSRLHETTVKRALTKDDIQRVINYESNSKKAYTELAIDLFTFSYFMGGINFVDISHLTQDNLIDDRLIYTRKKTGKIIKLPLQSQPKELINKYSTEKSLYLFPILSQFHKTDQQRANRVHKVIGKVNKRLKEIGNELNLPIDLTTYVARHSFATVLKRSGVSTSIICESLGHSSEKVTQIYLDSFENSQIDQAMKNLF